MEGIIESLEFSCLNWVVVTLISTTLHRINIHKLDVFLCLKCITFWSTLILTQNIFTAAVAALLSYIIDTYITRTKIQL